MLNMMYHETKIWSAFLIGHLVDGDSNILLLSAAPPSGGNIYNGLLYANFKWKAQELRCFGLWTLLPGFGNTETHVRIRGLENHTATGGTF